MRITKIRKTKATKYWQGLGIYEILILIYESEKLLPLLLENNVAVSMEAEQMHFFCPAIPLEGTYPKERHKNVHQKTCSGMFLAVVVPYVYSGNNTNVQIHYNG